MRIIIPVFLIMLLGITSCKKSDSVGNNQIEVSTPVIKSTLSGFVEKGPFVRGSKVQLFELDSDFNPTGKTFDTEITDDLGSFNFNSLSLASQYVKISVDGFYFDEVRGRLSTSRIVLNAIADIKNLNTLNVNILSHLEADRVLNLIKKDKFTFANAKKQAEKELLKGFNINVDLVSTSEQIRITDNNLQGNTLLAISCILLNNPSHSDASFTEQLSTLSQELKDNGAFSAKSTLLINTFKSTLYTSRLTEIIENIQKRYSDLGVSVKIDSFESFMKEHSISSDDPVDAIPVISKEDVISFWMHSKSLYAAFLEKYYVIDALSSHSRVYTDLPRSTVSIFNHSVRADDGYVRLLWADSYKAIQSLNMLIEKSKDSEDEEVKHIILQAVVVRANIYQGMTELWGDVVYLDKFNNGNWGTEDYYGRRESVAVIREKSIEAINSAISGVPYQTPNYSASLKSLRALGQGTLIRFYLQNKEYEKVRQVANSIMANGNFNLAVRQDLFSASSKETFGDYAINDSSGDPFKSVEFVKVARNGDFVHFMRYTEIILAAAEANLNLNNKDEAILLLNQVRVRNGRSPLSGVSSADILNSILNEYKSDLGQEGVYFAALKRNGLAETTLKIEGFRKLLPIPMMELMQNPYMTQNAGY